MPHQYHEAFLTTVFKYDDFPQDWPREFAIITAYATTGETWTDAQNIAADRQLEAELRGQGYPLHRIAGYSQDLTYHEDGWAVPMPLQAAWELAIKYKQVALFYYRNDECLLLYALETDAPNIIFSVPRVTQGTSQPFLPRS